MLKLMNDIVESMPLSMENAADGRYTWPARWSELFNKIENWPKGVSQQVVEADTEKPCNYDHIMLRRRGQRYCENCGLDLRTA